MEEFEVKMDPSPVIDWYGDTPVLSKELTEDGQAYILHGKLRMYDVDEDVYTKEGLDKMTDWDIYISSYDGGYIGTKKEYDYLTKEKGLVLIQKIHEQHNTCAIGYCPKENKWYGWSHRAIYGFGIGDEVHEGDLTATSGLIEEYRIQHPELDMSLPIGYRAKNLLGAKRMAIAFASAVD